MTGGSQLAGSQTSKHDMKLVRQDIARKTNYFAFARAVIVIMGTGINGSARLPAWLVSNRKVTCSMYISSTAVVCDQMCTWLPWMCIFKITRAQTAHRKEMAIEIEPLSLRSINIPRILLSSFHHPYEHLLSVMERDPERPQLAGMHYRHFNWARDCKWASRNVLGRCSIFEGTLTQQLRWIYHFFLATGSC